MAWDMIFVTDVHGNLLVFEYILRAAKELNIKNIVFGGDFAPRKAMIDFNKKMMFEPFHGEWHPYNEVFKQMGYWVLHTKMKPSAKNVEKAVAEVHKKFMPAQVSFTKNLAKTFGDFKKNNPGFEIYIMPGNNDDIKTLAVLAKAEKQGALKQVHMKTHKMGEFDLVGYGYISPTPFKFKYWEKPEKEIYKDLYKITKGLDPKKTIISTHVPPKDTPLDILWDGKSHVGSKAVRDFIRDWQPFMTLHGHIHEAPEVSGKFVTKIGKSMCINPGGSEEDVKAMLINTKDMKAKPLQVKFEMQVEEE